MIEVNFSRRRAARVLGGVTFLLGSVLAASGSAQTGEAQAPEMDTQATRALIEQFNDAWVNNDAARMARLVSDDVVQSYPPHEKTRKGREEVVNYLTGGPDSTADSILKMDTMVRTVHKLVVEGDTAVGFHRMTAELLEGGTYSNEYVWRHTCADGKVIRLEGMVDRLHVYNQIGDQPFLPGAPDN